MTLDDTIRKVAYFSTEIGLQNDIPTYSGGLAILAGDHLKAAADLRVPIVAISLMYHQGYFQQSIDSDGWQVEHYPSWDPSTKMRLMPQEVRIQVEGRDVRVKAWEYLIKGNSGFTVPAYFLDTNMPGNLPIDQNICSRLYGGEQSPDLKQYQRIAQEIVLGIGGVRFLRALGHKDNLETYHLNEGHAAFAAFQLLKENAWVDNLVRKLCVFTTHTPVPAGHDKFDYSLANRLLGYQTGSTKDMMPWHIDRLAGRQELNMTSLALSLSRYVNAVAKLHQIVCKKDENMDMFRGYNVHHITNGVHSATWTSPQFQDLFDKYTKGWRDDAKLLSNAGDIPDEEVWEAHKSRKAELIQYVNQKSAANFNENVLTMAFARRAATYKRGDLILSDLERLVDAAGDKEIQILFAGKAHPSDNPGKEVIQNIVQASKKLKGKVKVEFLSNYNMELGALLTSGCDVWLNTPVLGREASGTSGMKAAHNGIPNFGVPDGWLHEGLIEGITGWLIGPKYSKSIQRDDQRDRESFFNKLKHIIVPMYYNRRDDWTKIMKNAISINASFFNTHRMLEEYKKDSYGL